MKVKTGENELKDISGVIVKVGENATAATKEIHQVCMQDGKKVLRLVHTFGSGEIKFTAEWLIDERGRYIRVDVKNADKYTNLRYRFQDYANGSMYTQTLWRTENTKYPSSHCSDRIVISVRGTNSKGVQVTSTSEFILTDAEGWTVFHDVWEEHRQEPTCTEDGWVYYSCDCGHNTTETETIPAGHLYDGYAYPVGNGRHEIECSRCGSSTIIEDCTFVNGVCEKCGVKE